MVRYWIIQNHVDEYYRDEMDKWSHYIRKKWLFDGNSPCTKKVRAGDKVVLRLFEEGFKGKMEVTSAWEQEDGWTYFQEFEGVKVFRKPI